MQTWEKYESAAEHGPGPLLWKIGGLLLAVVVVVSTVGFVLGWFGQAADVTKEQLGPRAMLTKYEWFKDAAAQLDKKRADIQVYEARLKEATTVDRTDREQRMLWVTELSGIKAGYNGLAAEYNSQMSKFNWKFANVGELPAGATEPLPREFKTYMTN